MYFYIVLLFLLPLIMLSSITFHLEIIVADNERFRGIQIRFALPLYRFEQIYNHSDTRLSFLQTLLLNCWERSIGTKKDWNWERLRSLFLTGKHIHLLSDWEQQGYYMLKKALGYTVIEKITWQSQVGGKNAMWAALHTGMLWTIMGLGITFLANISCLKKVRLAVEPDYFSTEFNSQIDCILKMRMVHIITIAFYLIVWKVRWWLNGFAANTGQQPSY